MALHQDVKAWGDREFWGLNWDFDPQWILDEKQKEIQAKLIETCRVVIRSNAVSNAFGSCNFFSVFQQQFSVLFWT